MAKFILVRLEGKVRRLPATDAQAELIKTQLDQGNKNSAITIGESTFKLSQIQGVVGDEVSKGGLAFKGTNEHRQRLRRELIQAAIDCKICEKYEINGVTHGRGFINLGKDTADLCGCQKIVKSLNGVDPYDYAYLAAAGES
jgi:hypothetical protein